MKHREAITRVTFWGVADGDSWLNNWPVRGRTSYPLLFDRAGQPKPAFDAVIRTAKQPAFVPWRQAVVAIVWCPEDLWETQ